MASLSQCHSRIVAFAPTGRGFGFAVMEKGTILVDWGIKSVRAAKREVTVEKVQDLLERYQPDCVVVEDIFAVGCRKSARLRDLICLICSIANERQIGVESISRIDLVAMLCSQRNVTRHDARTVVCEVFSAELGDRCPTKRMPWESENYRSQLYDAVAFALASVRRSLK